MLEITPSAAQTMELTLYQVDAFSGRLFHGNPAAVVPLDEWLPEATMQAIALENNLSETAFFVRKGSAFSLRWFTPAREVDLCGHATLATAHVLFEHLNLTQKRITFHTRSGPLMVERRKDRYAMNFPTDVPKLIPTPKAITQAFSVHPEETYKGREDYLVVLNSQEQVEQLRPDFQQLRTLDGRGVIATAPGRDADMASRCFYPNYGIDEDPVTGSAHTTLAPYWAKRLNKNDLSAVQCSSRTGELLLHLMDERVEISGQAITYLVGRITC